MRRVTESQPLPISVCLIAENEAARIPRVLESVAGWTAEIIVVLNDDVNDGTDKIAASFGAKVFREPWKGFGPQKNSAVAKATQDWLLNLDADEEVTPGLRDEIRRAVTNPGPHAAFCFPRLTQFWGRWIRHGDWYPDLKVRLWRRGQARWSDAPVHETPVVGGTVGRLHGELRHYMTESYDQQLQKMLRYVDVFARECAARGRKVSIADIVFRPAWKFFRCYLLRLGFLDGRQGFTVACQGAIYTFLRYSKALEQQRQSARAK
jgi:glycosyltransferase involved in cell wall biosynthesis